MRQATHDQQVVFRASDTLVSALGETARTSGVTVSEYLRGIVREKVGLSDAPPPISFETRPLPLHTRAAQGDGEAMSALADLHYRKATGGSVPPVIALGQAVTYARLATIARGTRDDWLSMVFVAEEYATALRGQGMTDLADAAQAEAVALAEFMGLDGDEEVGRMVVAAADKISPRVMEIATGLHHYSKGVLDDADRAATS